MEINQNDLEAAVRNAELNAEQSTVGRPRTEYGGYYGKLLYDVNRAAKRPVTIKSLVYIARQLREDGMSYGRVYGPIRELVQTGRVTKLGQPGERGAGYWHNALGEPPE